MGFGILLLWVVIMVKEIKMVYITESTILIHWVLKRKKVELKKADIKGVWCELHYSHKYLYQRKSIHLSTLKGDLEFSSTWFLKYYKLEKALLNSFKILKKNKVPINDLEKEEYIREIQHFNQEKSKQDLITSFLVGTMV